MRKSTIIACLLGCSLFVPVAAFAADVDDALTPRTRKIYLEPEQSIFETGKLKFLTAFTAGYDNNSHLDSRRMGDPYTQEFFKGTFMAPLSNKTDITFDYSFMNLMYLGESKLDIITNGLRAGLDHDMTETLNVGGGYSLDMLDYINTGVDDYTDHTVFFSAKHRLPEKMFHALGYDIMYRDYSKRFTSTSSGVKTQKQRKDVRNTLSYEIGKYYAKDLLKFGLEYLNNNANEKYLNYYDYDALKYGMSVTHLFTERITGFMSVSRQDRVFRSRTLLSDARVKEKDRQYSVTTALYYTLNKSLTFGLNYSYRQNYSNEATERYSGSLISVSTYYKF